MAIVVPCYQHGRYLPECIASIRAQTLAPEQIIVVDDRSADPETDAALEQLEQDPGVTVLRLDVNSGPSVARNRALREVTANYVLPLDADDLLLPNALADMVRQLEQAPADVGFVYPNPQHFGNRNDYVQSPAYNLHLLLQDNYCPATALFDRRVFDAGATYAEEIVFGHEDWDLVLQLAELGSGARSPAAPRSGIAGAGSAGSTPSSTAPTRSTRRSRNGIRRSTPPRAGWRSRPAGRPRSRSCCSTRPERSGRTGTSSRWRRGLAPSPPWTSSCCCDRTPLRQLPKRVRTCGGSRRPWPHPTAMPCRSS